jgi:serine protease Do
MKKYATLIIGILLIWNAVLTIQYVGVKDLLDAMEITGEVKTIRTVVTEFDTNVTKVVKDNIKSVVRVTYYQGDSTSVSTGTIISTENGDVYIVTNHHSLNGVNRVSVTFNSGEEVDAVVVGSDSLNDLSLVKVTVDFRAEPFSVGDSSLVSIGTNVLSIGSPLGYEFTGSARWASSRPLTASLKPILTMMEKQIGITLFFKPMHP